MYTTLRSIEEHRPPSQVWDRLLDYLGDDVTEGTTVTVAQLTAALELEWAIWCLRAFNEREAAFRSVCDIEGRSYSMGAGHVNAEQVRRIAGESKIRLRRAAESQVPGAYETERQRQIGILCRHYSATSK